MFYPLGKKSRKTLGGGVASPPPPPLYVRRQEKIKLREQIPHIGPIPIVIPLKIFLNLILDPLFPRELILPMLTAGRCPTQCFATFANQIVNCSRRETTSVYVL